MPQKLLTPQQCKEAKCPSDKNFIRLRESGGLYLEVTKSGGKYWRVKYTFNGHENRHSIGVYPAISLEEARAKTAEAKGLLKQGQDPNHVKKLQKREHHYPDGQTFKEAALEWHKTKASSWSDSHAKKTLRQMERDLFPWIGNRLMKDIKGTEILYALRMVEDRGAIETADRELMICRQVWEYVALDGIEDATRGVKSKLKPYRGNKRPAIVEPSRFAELLRAIEGYKGTTTVRLALKLAPILFQRPGNLRTMQWAHLDLENGVWTIPSKDMKRERWEKENGEDHLVPLPLQAVEILSELKRYTGNFKYVFPGEKSVHNPMSDGAIQNALNTMGFKGEHCGHGFRASGRTMLDEQLGKDWRHLEAQLAHAVKDANGRSYNRTQFFKQRSEMLQDWADYLDKLRANTYSAAKPDQSQSIEPADGRLA